MDEQAATRRELLAVVGGFPSLALHPQSTSGGEPPTGSGFLLVKYRRAEPGTFARTANQLFAVGGFDSGSGVSVHHWIDPELDDAIIARSNSTPIQAMIQRALDEAPIGSTLIFLNGDYRVTDTLFQRRYLHLQGGGTTRIQGLLTHDDRNLYEMKLDAGPYGPSGDARRIKLDSVGFFLARGGHTAFLLDVTAKGAVPNLYVEIRRCGFHAPDQAGGYAAHIKGLATQGHLLVMNEVINTLFLDGCADGIAIEHNVFGGIKTGIVLDMAPGAFQTSIARNLIVCRDGAIRIRNGTQINIEENQIEQWGKNAAQPNAHLTIAPEDYIARAIRIRSNNFGAGSNIDCSIHAQGRPTARIDGLLIDMNVFNITASGNDIKLEGKDVRWTRIGESNEVRGARAGVVVDSAGRSAANSVDPGSLVAVSDGGIGTYGVWKPLVIAAPWRVAAGNPPSYRKLGDDSLILRGRVEGGRTSGPIFTLPPGFRPATPTTLIVPAGSGIAHLIYQPDGSVLLREPPGGSVELTGRLSVVGRTSYDPGY